MDAPENFELRPDCACFRPTRCASVQEVIDSIRDAIAYARSIDRNKLLIDLTHATYTEPSVADRYYSVHDWARESQFSVSVALVVRPEVFDPNAFSSTVAANAAFRFKVFTDESSALAWIGALSS